MNNKAIKTYNNIYKNPIQSDISWKDIEKLFPYVKKAALTQKDMRDAYSLNDEFGEYNYWRDTGMINYDSFEEYLKEKYMCKEVVV